MTSAIPVSFDFAQSGEKIKPMNAVNNGPAGSAVRKNAGNFATYAEAAFPFARTHDSAFYSGYGGEFTVDVHRIFRNFEADENAPASYSFRSTDTYLRNIHDAGTKTFYRLGAGIEHGEKYGTYPPKDYEKWARICEHIIRHYTEGWADGFHYDITYWEIWNEPDCHNGDGSNPCWQGDEMEFPNFFEVVLRHLKEKFPHLKIGGPAMASMWAEHSRKIYADILRRNLPADFYSYHWYGKTMQDFEATIYEAKRFFTEHGAADKETVLNEWNYIRGWAGEDWKYSLASEKGLKGSSFAASAMCVGQASPLDMLMYYDARPSGMNGLFDSTTLEPLKTYYTYLMFKDIAALGTHVPSKQDHENGLYSCAATNGEESAVFLSYYKDDDEAPVQNVKIECNNIPHSGKIKVERYLLDGDHSKTLVAEEIFTAKDFALYLSLPIYSTVLIKISPIA